MVFIADPFTQESGSRMYKTGDRARYHADGTIEFLGRADHLIKVRGFRIELAEIEAVIGQYPRVHESLVFVREDLPNDQRLIAYVVQEQEDAPLLDQESDEQKNNVVQQWKTIFELSGDQANFIAEI